jgi:hypothetical protein
VGTKPDLPRVIRELCYPKWALEAFIIAGAKKLVLCFFNQQSSCSYRTCFFFTGKLQNLLMALLIKCVDSRKTIMIALFINAQEKTPEFSYSKETTPSVFYMLY